MYQQVHGASQTHTSVYEETQDTVSTVRSHHTHTHSHTGHHIIQFFGGFGSGDGFATF